MSTTDGARPRARMQRQGERAPVTTLELFFDLVFVFALTRVTDLMADDLTGTGVLRGLLVLAVLWWSWIGYAWLANVVKADEGVVRITMFVAMIAMFVTALTIPESFDDLPGGLDGPVVFALGYFTIRLAHLVMFWVAAGDDVGLRRQLARFTPSFLVGTAMLLIASQLDGDVQLLFWALAFAGDYVGTRLGGASGWRLPSAGHFAERHGLIVIVALGESIVSIGIGVVELPVSWPIIAASALGLAVSGALWWTYFDTQALAVEHELAHRQGEARARLGRDGYTYLHLPMVAGIVLLSLGLKKVLSYVGDAEHHSVSDALTGVALYALFGGVVLYLLANVALKRIALRSTGLPRLVAAAVLVAAVPLAATLPALAALGILAAVMAALCTYETLHYAETRERLRHGGHAD